MNHKEMKEILNIAYKYNTPYFITGTIGIGKSVAVKELAMELAEKEKRTFVNWNKITKTQKMEVMANTEKYFLFIDQRASQFDLGDFKLPQLDNQTNNGYFEWRIPLVYSVICKPKAKGILFFDEFNISVSSVMAMFYSIINDRFIGEHKISDGIFIIGAGNTSNDVSYVNELGNALKDRFEHITLKIPDIEEFTEYCMNHGVDPRIVGFLQFRPTLLHKIPTESSDSAFPTPRGWSERLSPMLKDIPSDKLELIERVVGSHVGTSVGIEFAAFIKLAYQVDLDAILENPEKIKELDTMDLESDLERPGLKYSVLSALADRFRQDNKLIESMAKISTYLEAEYGIMLLRLCKSGDIKGYKSISNKAIENKEKFPYFIDFLYKNQGYLI